MVASGVIHLCFDSRILAEYREVLLRAKFGFSEHHVDALLDQIKSQGQIFFGEPLSFKLLDPDDEFFLEVALAAKVSYLVTGNLKHYVTPKITRIKIVAPTRFLEIYRTLREHR